MRGNARSQLIAKNVPLKTRRRAEQLRRRRCKRGVSAMGKFFVWAAAKQRERRAIILKHGRRGKHGGRASYLAFMRELSAAWRQGDRYVAKNNIIDDDYACQSGPSYADKICNDLWGISSEDSPVCPKVLHEEGCRITGRSAGFGVEALQPARDGFLRRVCVRDKGGILDSWKSKCHTPCCLLHPGFCVKTMQGKPLFQSCHLDLCVALCALARGTFIGIRWRHGWGNASQRLFAVANSDDAGRVVLVRCDADPLLFMGVHEDVDPPSVRMIANRGFDFVMTQTVLQEVRVVAVSVDLLLWFCSCRLLPLAQVTNNIVGCLVLYVHVYLYICIRIGICVYVYMHICICVYVYAYMYMHMYTTIPSDLLVFHFICLFLNYLCVLPGHCIIL